MQRLLLIGLIQKILGKYILFSTGLGSHPNEKDVGFGLGLLTGNIGGGGILQVLPRHSTTEPQHHQAAKPA